MKVYCIDNKYLSLAIEVGKWYYVKQVEEGSGSSSYLISKGNKILRISKSKFLTIEQIRKEKFTILGL
jgi:hypothetical protein